MSVRSGIKQFLRTDWGNPSNSSMYKENLVGIELEYERCRIPEDYNGKCKYWLLTGDGSLRDGGLELVSSPLAFHETERALTEAEKMVKLFGGVATSRCGLHTHMNMRPYSVGQVWSLSCLYALIEPTLYLTYAPGREDCMFAVPLWANTALTQSLYRDICNVRSFHINSHYCASAQTSKYSALNFSALVGLGTLEMRQPSCSNNFEAISGWVEFCKRLIVQGVKYQDPLHVLTDYERRGLASFQRSLFGQHYSTDTYRQELAEDTAYLIAGYNEPSWEEMTWDQTLIEETS